MIWSVIWTVFLLTSQPIDASIDQIEVYHPNNRFTKLLKLISSVLNTSEYTATIIVIDVDNIMKAMNVQFNTNVFVVYDNKYSKELPSYNGYNSSFLFLLNKPSQANIYRFLKRFYKWNNYDLQTPVIIYIPYVTAEEEYTCLVWLKQIFKQLWSQNLVRVLIIFWSQIGKSLQWYNYHVFFKIIYNQTGNYDLSKNLSEASRNLQGFPLEICFHNATPFSIIMPDRNGKRLISGIDGFMMRTILKSMNATYHIVPFEGEHGAQIPESRQAVIDRKCDVLFTSQYFVDNSKPDLQYLYPVARDAWCIMVPKAGKKSDVYRFIRPFSVEIWIAVMFSTHCAFMVWCWYFRICADAALLSREDQKLNFFHVVSILLNVTLPIKMSKLSPATRTLVMSLVVYNIIVSYSYLALLFGSLITPVYQRDMHTLRDVNISGLKVITPESEFDRWSEMGLNNSELLNDMLVVEKNMTKIMEMQETHRLDYGYTVTIRPASFRVRFSKHYRDGRPLYHIVEECFLPTHSSYAVTLDFPFPRRIEHYQRLILESGITMIWDIVSKFEYTSLVPYRYHRKEKYETNMSVIALQLSHFVGIFYAWGFGVLISVLVFLIERWQ